MILLSRKPITVDNCVYTLDLFKALEDSYIYKFEKVTYNENKTEELERESILIDIINSDELYKITYDIVNYWNFYYNLYCNMYPFTIHVRLTADQSKFDIVKYRATNVTEHPTYRNKFNKVVNVYTKDKNKVFFNENDINDDSNEPVYELNIWSDRSDEAVNAYLDERLEELRQAVLNYINKQGDIS